MLSTVPPSLTVDSTPQTQELVLAKSQELLVSIKLVLMPQPVSPPMLNVTLSSLAASQAVLDVSLLTFLVPLKLVLPLLAQLSSD